jgi:hypothetical protein
MISGSKKEKTMAIQAVNKVPAPKQSSGLEQKIQKLREIYADGSEFSKTALENVIRAVQSGGPATESQPMESAGRIGARRGKVSELTCLFPIKPIGAKRLRAFLELLHPSLGNQGVDRVGTVHDMRFVFLDNDTKLLFCTAYDGDWDPYVDDFATKIPDILDLQLAEVEGWPGIRSPKIKDFVVKYQIPAYFWYVANPDLTVAETKRLEKVGKALDEFLDKVG